MTHFSTELASQPSVWRHAQTLADSLREKLPADGSRVGIIGCGTSLYVAQATAIYRERQGAGETDAFPGSEVPAHRPWENVIAISRSGTTTEIIDAVTALPQGTQVLGITGEKGSPLSAVLTEELDLPFADERSVVQTRFATTVLTLLLGAYGWDVEASAQKAERHLQEPLPDWAGEIQQFVFLGRGVGMALAHEAALKFREILATWSEAYATMEYRHGPISAINERSLVWILDAEEPSIDDQIRATGARLIRGEGDPLAELVRIHRFAEGLVDLRGINPDQPPHISRSVVLAGDR
ncbi:MAG: SIS domain-containing protein [Solirubrobacteraceae bacterium]